jgi:hypothetical protein
MDVAARVDLGVIDEAQRRHRRRWSVVVIVALAVFAASIGFAVNRGGGGQTSASVGARQRPAHGGSHALGSLGRCASLGIPTGDRGRIEAVLPLCVRREGRPGTSRGVLGRNKSQSKAPSRERVTSFRDS